MPFLTIGGIDVEIEAPANELEPEEIGARRRAYSGNMRTSVRKLLRGWQVTTIMMEQAAIAALRATYANGQFVNCSGDALGATYQCSVREVGAPYLHSGASFVRTLTLEIRQTTGVAI